MCMSWWGRRVFYPLTHAVPRLRRLAASQIDISWPRSLQGHLLSTDRINISSSNELMYHGVVVDYWQTATSVTYLHTSCQPSSAIHAFVTSRLDCCNAVVFGVAAVRLQSVLNAARFMPSLHVKWNICAAFFIISAKWMTEIMCSFDVCLCLCVCVCLCAAGRSIRPV